MPDTKPKSEPLNLAGDFLPTPASEWEEAIAKDLKGADYEKKLVWRTEEGLAVRPYYRKEDLQGIEEQLNFRKTSRGWDTAPDQTPSSEAIRADLLHEAGAHAVQELGYALAAGVERLVSLNASQPAGAASPIEFVFSIGPNYFIEIAKLRAARLLWAQVVAAFGAGDKGSRGIRIHACTPRRNKSVYDRYTNLLRATTEALSAVIGGCDRLTIEPFGFDGRLALNIQRILREESHMDAVADPSGGSYYIEALTDSIAREAWELFRKVEAEGGYDKALKSGSIAAALAQSRAARDKATSSRRRISVGVNNYPDLSEKTPGAQAPAPLSSPLPQYRPAEPFEAIRRRTGEHARVVGRYPKILLLKRGDVKMKGARANFCLNFFGCAGFDIAQSEQYEKSDADMIILCSSDSEYLPLAQEVCPKVDIPVMVAGNPKDQIEQLQAAGVQGFVHALSDAVATLTECQNKLGMRSAS